MCDSSMNAISKQPEGCLRVPSKHSPLGLPYRLVPEGSEAEFQPSPFFSEQLTAFELWLQHGSKDKQPPEQLPIVLQVSHASCINLLLPLNGVSEVWSGHTWLSMTQVAGQMTYLPAAMNA